MTRLLHMTSNGRSAPRILAFILAVFASFLIGKNVFALTVSPVIIDRTMDPGKTIAGSIRLLNDTENPVTYYTTVQNFVAEGEDGHQTFLPTSDKSGLVGWMSLQAPSITIPPREVKDFSWSLSLPAGAEPGGHYAAMFFSTQPPQEEGVGVGIGAKVGVLFLLNVTGNVKELADVESFRVYGEGANHLLQESSVLSRLPVDFELRVRNQGSVHLDPQGTIRVTNIFGGVVADVPANPLDSKVLPNSIRKVRSSWGPQDIEQGAGFFEGVRTEWVGFAMGRYTANADVGYGKQGQRLRATVSFWIIPWHLLTCLLLLILILAFLLHGYNQLIIRSAVRKKK